MKVLLTGAASELGRATTDALRRERHRVHLTDRRRLRSPLPFTQSQLGHGRQIDALVAGMKTVVHIPGPVERDSDAATWIDTCTRCTYNLLVACVDAGVQHFVYLGSLDAFLGYDADFLVSPSWRPVPTIEPAVMAPQLGEFVAREFAQTAQIRLTVVRLGHLVCADRIGPDEPLDPLAIDPRDAAAGVAAAVAETDEEPSNYRLFHLQGDFDGARFAPGGRRQLDVDLQFDFGRPRQGGDTP